MPAQRFAGHALGSAFHEFGRLRNYADAKPHGAPHKAPHYTKVQDTKVQDTNVQ